MKHVKMRLPWVLSWLFLLLAILLGGTLGKSLARVGASMLLGKSAPNSLNSVKWGREKLGYITLETPYPLVGETYDLGKLPESGRELIERMIVFSDGRAEPLSLRVGVVTYKAGLSINLDGAVDGAVRSVAATLGDRNPEFNILNESINGKKARSAAYHYGAGRQKLSFQTLSLAVEQTVYSIQVTSGLDVSEAVVQRIFRSVSVVDPTENQPIASKHDSR